LPSSSPRGSSESGSYNDVIAALGEESHKEDWLKRPPNDVKKLSKKEAKKQKRLARAKENRAAAAVMAAASVVAVVATVGEQSSSKDVPANQAVREKSKMSSVVAPDVISDAAPCVPPAQSDLYSEILSGSVQNRPTTAMISLDTVPAIPPLSDITPIFRTP
jgi:hypothetical protein